MSSTAEQPKVGLRTWLIALLAAGSIQDPWLVLRFGPFVALLVILTGRPGRLRVDGAVVFSSAFALWTVASLTWARFPEPTAAAALMVGAAVVLFVGTLDLIKTVAQLQIVAFGFLGGAFFSVIQVFIQNRGQFDGAERLSLEGLNPNYLAYALSTAFAMLVLLWVTGEGSRRFWLAAAAVVLILGVEATGTRAAYLSVAMLAIWITVCRFFGRPPLGMLVAAIAVASFVIVSGFWDAKLGSWDVGGERSTGDWSERLVVWPAARDLWSENVWVGVGFGGFDYATVFGIGAHNVFLQLGSGIGVIGVILFVAVWLCALWPAVRHGGPSAAFLVGSFLAVAAPPYLTGYWESAPAAWIALAVFSRVEVLGSVTASGLTLNRTESDGGSGYWIPTRGWSARFGA